MSLTPSNIMTTQSGDNLWTMVRRARPDIAGDSSEVGKLVKILQESNGDEFTKKTNDRKLQVGDEVNISAILPEPAVEEIAIEPAIVNNAPIPMIDPNQGIQQPNNVNDIFGSLFGFEPNFGFNQDPGFNQNPGFDPNFGFDPNQFAFDPAVFGFDPNQFVPGNFQVNGGGMGISGLLASIQNDPTAAIQNPGLFGNTFLNLIGGRQL